MAALGALLERWRADRGLLALLMVVVVLVAGLVGAVPGLLRSLATASLDDALDSSTVDRTGLAATIIRPFSAGSAETAAERLEAAAATLDEELDPRLQAALQPPTAVVDSVRYDLGPLPGGPPEAFEHKLTIRLDPGAADALEVVEGSLPDGEVGSIDLDLGEDAPTTLPVHQFAVTASTAESLGMAVGDRRLATPDEGGPLLLRVPLAPTAPVVLELSAIVELAPVDDPIWFGDPGLHRAATFDTNSSTTVFSTGLVTVEGAAELPGAREGQVAGVDVRWHLDREGLLAGDTAAVEQEARALRSTPAFQLDDPRWRTGLDRVLATEAARRATAVEVLGLGAVAVLGVGLALLVAVAALLASRRRDATALVRGRGAGRAQLLGAAVVEFGAVCAAGAVLAAAVLLLALPGGGGVVLPLVGVVALLALVVLVAGSARDVRRPLGLLLAERRRASPPRPARHVLDGMLVLVAVVAVATLRRRGVTADGTVEPLVVAAPVLVAIAVAVLATRMAPLPLRAAEAAARRGRRLALPVGLARAARSVAAGGVVVVLLVLGLGVAGLAASVHSSLVDGQARAAQEQVGAPVRIDAAPLASLDPDWEPPSTADRVADVAIVSRTIATTDVGALRVDLLAVDPAALAALDLPQDLPDLTWDGIGSAPLLVSSEMAPLGSPQVEDALGLVIGLDRITGHIAAIDPRALGRDDEEDGEFVVVDRAALVAATGVDPGTSSRLVSTTEPAAVEASAIAVDPDATVEVRDQVEAALRDAPLSAGVRIGYLVAAGAAVVATAAAVLMALATSAPERRRQAAVLAALGTQRRGIRATVLAEVLPLVVAAAVVGIVLAGGVTELLADRLDLAPFTGTVDATALRPPHPVVAGMLVAGALLVAAAGAIITLGRVDPGALLREGDG